MKDIDYSVYGLDEIHCDGCDIKLCNGFIEHAFDAGFLCDDCKDFRWFKDALAHVVQLESRIEELKNQFECKYFQDGHDFKDITSNCLVSGHQVLKCVKCEYIEQIALPSLPSINNYSGLLDAATKKDVFVWPKYYP